MDTEKKIWGIHTFAGDEDLFLNKNIIAIGWSEMGDLSQIPADRDAFKQKCVDEYPNIKKGAVPTIAGMLLRFCYEIQPDDLVVFPSKKDRMINIGKITGDYKYDPKQGRLPQTRSVKWIKHLPRTAFSQGALYEIGSAMTFFSIKNYADEFLAALGSKPAPVAESDDTVGVTADEIIDATRDYVLKELSKNLKGFGLEFFVADLLRAMGYRTTVSPQGGDSGIDIRAYKDELPPRIVVQVKSQDGDVKESVLQSLKGAMKDGDYGLFVTLSNYTKNALNYLENTPSIRGINGVELVDLILKYYDDLDDKYKRMIPLKKVFIPVPKDDDEGIPAAETAGGSQSGATDGPTTDKNKRSPIKFSLCGIPAGATLVYTENPSITVKVTDDRHVMFQGEETSLSAVAALLSDREHVRGTDFFTYEGERISEIAERTQWKAK